MSSDSPAFGKVIEQKPVPIPDLSIKDLLSAIPAHCFQRSALRSSVYIAWDFFLLACIYSSTKFLDARITPEHITLPHPILYTAASFALWTFYTFAAGLVATGLWVIAHECGHQAFSESKTINNVVGWVLHSALGVPYHSWRITHAKHHASTSHLLQDQVFVPKTRSQAGLAPLDPTKEDLGGASVSAEVMNELWEALGDTPLSAAWGSLSYLLFGWFAYSLFNISGQKRYPKNTSHYNPNAIIFKPEQYSQVVISAVGVFLWLAGMGTFAYYAGPLELFRVYFAPYLWVNHWLILITFLQHTDPVLPHYRPAEFTFPRGALSTLDRQLLGDLGPIGAWIGARATHGISETHVAHHVSSKIPHYHAWEATDALRARLAASGIKLEGRPGGWAEMYRVFRECKFVEDDGDVVFFKNAYGLAASKPLFADVIDSGIEVDKE